MTSVRRRPSRAVSAVALGAAALLLAACGSSSDGGGTTSAAPADSTSAASNLPKTLVFSPLSLAPPALKGLSEGVKGYAGSQGWEVIVQDPNFDPNKQVQQLNEVLDSGRAGAAWVIAVAPASMGDVLKSAQSKGIPILVNGTPQEWGFDGPQPGVTFDYIDYAAGGTAMGEQLGKCMNEKASGKGEVFFLKSTQGQAGQEEFEKAAKDALASTAPGVTIVQEITAKDRAQSQTDVGSALQGHPDAAGFMSSNDEGALGGLGAFDAAGKTATCVTEFGGNDEVLALVKKGTIYASVALQFAADMTQSFDTLVKMQADPTAEGLVLTVPQKVITQSS